MGAGRHGSNGPHNLLMGSMHVPDRVLRRPAPRILQSYRVLVTEYADVNADATPVVRWRAALTAADVAALRQQMGVHGAVGIGCRDRRRAGDGAGATDTARRESARVSALFIGGVCFAGADHQMIERARLRYGPLQAYLETPEQAGDAPRAVSKGDRWCRERTEYALRIVGRGAQHRPISSTR
ncbi:hypothetical protein J2797_006352 [Paraburkholderia terricola]|uniref:hypothetical protein n=1 Tax=Paraburkholderia terricola TaxID=169427 RepID=UPI0028568DFB|nr:hypothetical protein [Paraburkholderia terricola]MDR6496425.1 hypothetical protein [Paraburkholderia terricola]